MPDNRERRRLRLGRGLLRLWLVSSAFWIAAIGYAFWSLNGGAGARWVWNSTAAERTPVAAQQWTLQEFSSVAQGAANIASRKASGEKGLTWEEAMSQPAPNKNAKTSVTPVEFSVGQPNQVIISQQFGAFVLLATAPPGFVLALGASLAWAFRGFRE
jgi:hypothetical protein